MPLRLRDIAAAAGLRVPHDTDPSCNSVTEDSRRVTPGSLFCAVVGEASDGHNFAKAAAAAGACAILGEREGIESLEGLPYVYTEHVRRATGIIAHAIAGHPSRTMRVIGITGTNGKSSTALLTTHILESAGHRCAVLGTLGYTVAGESRPAPHTTPFGEDLATLFAEAREAGCTHLVMEVSSHAIAQERIAGIEYTGAAFTNLTQDHLDFHETMEAYLAAKLMLFDRVTGQESFCVVNHDDESGDAFIARAPSRCITFGRESDCRAVGVHTHSGGTDYELHTPDGHASVSTVLIGQHNVQNALCAAAIATGLGIAVGPIAEALSTAPVVPGRFEAVNEGQDFLVAVDYAHTDDGLTNVLQAARAICDGRVITVFGCGGDRDRTKRPRMAKAAAALSDYCIITSDNPRTEDPQRILDDTEAGMIAEGRRRDEDYTVIADRRRAIQEAIGMALAGDLVMIAGKGHEDYQILGTERIHFDDCEEARAALRAVRS